MIYSEAEHSDIYHGIYSSRLKQLYNIIFTSSSSSRNRFPDHLLSALLVASSLDTGTGKAENPEVDHVEQMLE